MGSVDTESLFRAFLRKNITLRTGTLHELETVRLSEASQHFPAVASRGLVGGARRNPQGLGEGILPEGRTAACTGKGIPPPPAPAAAGHGQPLGGSEASHSPEGSPAQLQPRNPHNSISGILNNRSYNQVRPLSRYHPQPQAAHTRPWVPFQLLSIHLMRK